MLAGVSASGFSRWMEPEIMIFRPAKCKTLAKGSNFIGTAEYKRLFAGRKPSYKGCFLSGYCVDREKFDPLAGVFWRRGQSSGIWRRRMPAVMADACSGEDVLGGEGACGGDSYSRIEKAPRCSSGWLRQACHSANKLLTLVKTRRCRRACE